MTTDLMTYLYSKYKAQLTENRIPELDEFLDFAREHLRQNQPVSWELGAGTPCVRLQDSTLVSFVQLAEMQATGGNPGFIPITNPADKADPMAARSSQNFSFGITGTNTSKS